MLSLKSDRSVWKKNPHKNTYIKLKHDPDVAYKINELIKPWVH